MTLNVYLWGGGEIIFDLRLIFKNSGNHLIFKLVKLEIYFGDFSWMCVNHRLRI